jgi:hypothetical protein
MDTSDSEDQPIGVGFPPINPQEMEIPPNSSDLIDSQASENPKKKKTKKPRNKKSKHAQIPSTKVIDLVDDKENDLAGLKFKPLVIDMDTLKKTAEDASNSLNNFTAWKPYSSTLFTQAPWTFQQIPPLPSLRPLIAKTDARARIPIIGLPDTTHSKSIFVGPPLIAHQQMPPPSQVYQPEEHQPLPSLFPYSSARNSVELANPYFIHPLISYQTSPGFADNYPSQQSARGIGGFPYPRMNAEPFLPPFAYTQHPQFMMDAHPLVIDTSFQSLQQYNSPDSTRMTTTLPSSTSSQDNFSPYHPQPAPLLQKQQPPRSFPYLSGPPPSSSSSSFPSSTPRMVDNIHDPSLEETLSLHNPFLTNATPGASVKEKSNPDKSKSHPPNEETPTF